MVEQAFDRHACAVEYRRSAKDLRVDVDGLLIHKENIQQKQFAAKVLAYFVPEVFARIRAVMIALLLCKFGDFLIY